MVGAAGDLPTSDRRSANEPPPARGDLPERRTPTLFADDFEAGSVAPETTRDLPTNQSGFVWRSNNRTAVVRDEWPDGGRVVWENGPADEFVEGADYRTPHGSNALRFRYPPEESWAE